MARRDGCAVTWPEATHGVGKQAYRTAGECIDWQVPPVSIFNRSRPLQPATLDRIARGVMRYVVKAERPYLAPATVDWASGENRSDLVAAFLAKHYTGVVGQTIDRPIGTITAIDHHSLVTCHLTKWSGTSTGGSGQGQVVAAFLTKYYSSGSTAQSLREPLHTIVSKARFGLVTVHVGGNPYAITDIRMRMLTARELARGQGFPDSYQLVGTTAEQIARVGNSVCPDVARALVAAQLNKGESCAA